MKLETLNERIANAEAKIEKKTATIAKKTALISKKEAMLTKADEKEKWWIECEIEHLHEDIERNTNEIAELTKALEGYKGQIAEAEQRVAFLREIPQNMKTMQNDLVNIWDEYDIARREHLRDEYNKLGYREFFKKHNRADYEMKSKTTDEIHTENMNAAESMILNLIYRVRDTVGEITDWKGIRVEIGTWGFPVLNGIVIGKLGKCKVESIDAGGYNIQRYHIRVLVKEII